MNAVRWAVIPVAGRGSRMQPLSRAVPKELLPLGRKAVLHHVIDELVAAGLRDLVFVTSRAKPAIREFLSDREFWRQQLQPMTADEVRMHFAEQPQPLGLGDAVLQAHSLVGSQPFVVALGDSVFDPFGARSLLPRMIDAARDLADAAVIALEQVPLADVSKYGIAQVENIGVNFRLLELVEKPTSETAPSRWAIAGRYLLTRTIFDHLRSIAPGSGGEIQLTDALRASVKAGGPSVGVPLEAGQRRYDVGEFESYFRAFEDFARVALRPTHGATRADTLADAAQNPFATDRDQSVGRACARAGLLGNPSDGYGGKVISCILGNWQAEVRVSPSQHIEFLTGLGESPSFESASAFVSTVRRQGYYGGLRLVQAATKRFFEYCGPKLSRDQWKQNFQVEYQSNIPRQLGLGGSSAIVIATLRALSAFFGVALPQEWLPSLALSAETQELGIPAGLQDRVIQTYEGLMYMDFASETIDAASHLKRGEYQRLDERLLPDLYVAFRHTAAEPTEVVHSDLRKRFDQGDSNVVSAMRQFAEFARLGREAILRQDIDELARLMNANFDLRRSVCQILPEQLELIQVARGCGVCAKFCGSGGAVVGILSDPKAFERLRQAMASIGASVFQPKIGIWH